MVKIVEDPNKLRNRNIIKIKEILNNADIKFSTNTFNERFLYIWQDTKCIGCVMYCSDKEIYIKGEKDIFMDVALLLEENEFKVIIYDTTV